MDSLQRIKDFFKNLSDFAFKERARVYNGICSLEIKPQGVSFVYIKHNNHTFDLQAANFIPCTIADLGLVLADLVIKYHLENTACTWLLTPDKYQLIQIEDLPVPKEEFQSAVRWQVKKLLSFPVDDAFIDRFPIPAPQIGNPKKHIELVVAQKSYIQPIATLMLESGLNLTTIDIQELSLRNISALFETNDKSTALIYLQEKNSVISITQQKIFYFSRKLDWSLDNFIAIENDIEAAHEMLDKLALELHRSFDYFQGQWRQSAPTRILIAPTKKTAIDITAYLTQRLSLTLQTLNLNLAMKSRINLDLDIQGKYLPLIGAALREDEASYATAD